MNQNSMSDEANLTKLESLLKERKIDAFNQRLDEAFSSSENPVALFLDLIEHCKAKKKLKSVAFHVVQNFST